MGHLEVHAHLKIRPGRLEGFKAQAAEIIRLTREKDAQTIRYDWFINEDGTECEVREVYDLARRKAGSGFDLREKTAAVLAQMSAVVTYGDYAIASNRLLAQLPEKVRERQVQRRGRRGCGEGMPDPDVLSKVLPEPGEEVGIPDVIGEDFRV